MCRLMETGRQYASKQVTYQVVMRYGFHIDTWIWLNHVKLPIYNPLTYQQVNFTRFNLLHTQTKWCKKKTDRQWFLQEGRLRRRNAGSEHSGLINFFIPWMCCLFKTNIFNYIIHRSIIELAHRERQKIGKDGVRTKKRRWNFFLMQK